MLKDTFIEGEQNIHNKERRKKIILHTLVESSNHTNIQNNRISMGKSLDISSSPSLLLSNKLEIN
jgi:hypothetical protein